MTLSYESAAEALAWYGDRCVSCGEQAESWHHVFYTRAFPELADDPGNVIPVCKDCHMRHHSAHKRLPRALIASAEGLATSNQRRAFLDRIYGPVVADARVVDEAAVEL